MAFDPRLIVEILKVVPADKLVDLLGGLFKNKPEAPKPPVVVAPPVPSDPDVVDPGISKPGTPPPATPVLRSLDLALAWAAGDPGQPDCDEQGLRKDIDEIRAGASAVNWAHNFKFDLTPRDQFGKEMGPGAAPGSEAGVLPEIVYTVTLRGPGNVVEGPVEIGPVAEGEVDWSAGIADLSVVPRSYFIPRGYGLTIRFNQRRSGRWYAHVGAKHARAEFVESNTVRVALD